MHRLPIALALGALAGGCATTGGTDEPSTPVTNTMQCDVGGVQDLVGKPATVETGTAIRNRSGSRELRWGAPDSAWTMDYRPDRVNVRYDRNMIITEITCG